MILIWGLSERALTAHLKAATFSFCVLANYSIRCVFFWEYHIIFERMFLFWRFMFPQRHRRHRKQNSVWWIQCTFNLRIKMMVEKRVWHFFKCRSGDKTSKKRGRPSFFSSFIAGLRHWKSQTWPLHCSQSIQCFSPHALNLCIWFVIPLRRRSLSI